MPDRKPLRHEDFDRPVDQFVTRVAECGLQLAVRELDVAVGIDDHSRVWRRVQDLFEQVLALETRGLVADDVLKDPSAPAGE